MQQDCTAWQDHSQTLIGWGSHKRNHKTLNKAQLLIVYSIGLAHMHAPVVLHPGVHVSKRKKARVRMHSHRMKENKGESSYNTYNHDGKRRCKGKAVEERG